MACGELLSYIEQLGTDNVGGLVLVDGCIAEKPSPEIFTAWSGRMNQLQQDRQKQEDGFVRNMYKKLQAEEYLRRVVSASTQVPTDTAVTLIYNMIAVRDFSASSARLNRPYLWKTPKAMPIIASTHMSQIIKGVL